MRVTTNLGLKVWDSNDDQFNPADLENNWDNIEADYSRPRPTDRAEILATIPATGNFAGRLVYLSTASGGIPAHTLIRFDGSAWRAVGPHEILPAVPTSGNFAGRMVLLSTAASGFAAWTLISFTGSVWQEVGRQITVSSTLPVTGNFNGRVVVLSAADSGFAAWDAVVFDGTTYRLIGPAREAPLASSIGSLTTANGRKGTILAGTELVPLTYSTSLAKWKSNVQYALVHQTGTATTQSVTYGPMDATLYASPWIPWGSLGVGALKAEVNLVVELSSNGSGTTAFCAVVHRLCNANAVPGGFGAEMIETSVTGVTPTLRASGWFPATLGVGDYLNFGLNIRSSTSSQIATINRASLQFRWSS